jgi:methylthioribulose-1-phosphate dehydratase
MKNVDLFSDAAKQIMAAGVFLYNRGWSPATSSNYSIRLEEGIVAVTVSGKHKGCLQVNDIMKVDLDGQPIESNAKPSAETLLHTALYRQFSNINAVLHTHSVFATLLSRLLKGKNQLVFEGYELQKAFEGQNTHEARMIIPIFENTQNIRELSERVLDYLSQNPECHGYLIRGHGLYTWGSSMDNCLRHIEAFEFLLECELESLKINGIERELS